MARFFNKQNGFLPVMNDIYYICNYGLADLAVWAYVMMHSWIEL